ncbi:gluconokinase [Paludibacterium yongneupense]|uniref:gluconokinase n=1 Tax=Paludibacterium yongneupense TaxID=400061 RepID=UPI000405AE88|nr:gluconokinase [Paludibacterium yongneupense]
MKKIRIVVMGVCGCGKSEIGSRLAAALSCRFIEGDAFHPRSNLDKMSAAIPLTDADRQGWLEILAAEIGHAREEDRGIVLSCSALKRKYRDILRRGDPGLVFVYLRGSHAQISARMGARQGHFMPVALIDSQFADLETPEADERSITCDIDPPPDIMLATLTARLGEM